MGRKYEQNSVLIIPKGGNGAFQYGTSKYGGPGLNRIKSEGKIEFNKDRQIHTRKQGGIRFSFTMDKGKEYEEIKENYRILGYNNFIQK